ncbi:HbrB-domain-containing protein [Coniophora puteana RWD-64-598 SS2]|uniref:HbrB-domain-containing protein n=1 Tax=Coniophora puteana (strain RWD-64-598) TaxID=741705 RepID=A0A5M3MWB3_CONPW|nr:HbrB-domain-containing protein [Coniophora puteana RWD-64-598 SS2]EIW83277.1 HbrB-domain-containing protein [Coniophora puteana RWD-64-598 SS2]
MTTPSASSSAMPNKVHTSPAKSTVGRTYDAKLVSREMHRLGTLVTPASSTLTLPTAAPSLSISHSMSGVSAGASPGASSMNTNGGSSGVGVSGLSPGMVVAAAEKDNAWGTLHVHVLPLFNDLPLRVPIEDLNALVSRHIQTVISASPPKALSVLESDTRELIGAGMVTLNAKLVNLDDQLITLRVVEMWEFFWDQILPYIEAVLLPLQNDKLLSSLRHKQPVREHGLPTLTHTQTCSWIHIRDIALRALRDRVILPLQNRLRLRLEAPWTKDTWIRLGESGQRRYQQMLLVLSSQKNRIPATSLALHAPRQEPTAGEAAISELLAAFRLNRPTMLPHAFNYGHSASKSLNTLGSMGSAGSRRANTPSFLSSREPRDRRGRIAGRGVQMAGVIFGPGGWPGYEGVNSVEQEDAPDAEEYSTGDDYESDEDMFRGSHSLRPSTELEHALSSHAHSEAFNRADGRAWRTGTDLLDEDGDTNGTNEGGETPRLGGMESAAPRFALAMNALRHRPSFETRPSYESRPSLESRSSDGGARNSFDSSSLSSARLSLDRDREREYAFTDSAPNSANSANWSASRTARPSLDVPRRSLDTEWDRDRDNAPRSANSFGSGTASGSGRTTARPSLDVPRRSLDAALDRPNLTINNSGSRSPRRSADMLRRPSPSPSPGPGPSPTRPSIDTRRPSATAANTESISPRPSPIDERRHGRPSLDVLQPGLPPPPPPKDSNSSASLREERRRSRTEDVRRPSLDARPNLGHERHERGHERARTADGLLNEEDGMDWDSAQVGSSGSVSGSASV